MTAREIMTHDVAVCTPDEPAAQAARLMAQHDCGCIPVVEDQESRKLVGVVTDRDIAVRGVARGRDSDTPVRELMSSDLTCCSPDTDAHEIGRAMAERQIRRVPVIDGLGACIGMVAQADLARSSDNEIGDREVGRVVERISEPPERQKV